MAEYIWARCVLPVQQGASGSGSEGEDGSGSSSGEEEEEEEEEGGGAGAGPKARVKNDKGAWGSASGPCVDGLQGVRGSN